MGFLKNPRAAIVTSLANCPEDTGEELKYIHALQSALDYVFCSAHAQLPPEGGGVPATGGLTPRGACPSPGCRGAAALSPPPRHSRGERPGSKEPALRPVREAAGIRGPCWEPRVCVSAGGRCPGVRVCRSRPGGGVGARHIPQEPQGPGPEESRPQLPSSPEGGALAVPEKLRAAPAVELSVSRDPRGGGAGCPLR